MTKLPIYDSSGNSNLICPWCEEEYLHQFRVTVFGRTEDEDTTRVFATKTDGRSPSTVAYSQEASTECGNPSDRRHGMTIEFWCEHCSIDDKGNIVETQMPVLMLAQHKGVTFIGWGDTGRPMPGAAK
jgi:hypothetical protein